MLVPSSSLEAAAAAPPPLGVVSKRARISERKRIFARELQQNLELLRGLYKDHHRVPELGDILDKAILSTHRLSESTRESDLRLVLEVLHKWDVVEVGELLEETGLSRWNLDEILKDESVKPLVKINKDIRATPEGGRPGHLLRLTSKGRKYCDEIFPPQVKN